MKRSIQDNYLEYLTAALTSVFLVLLYLKGQYGWGVACLIILLILARLDALKSLSMSVKDGSLKAEFADQKIIDNIRENKEPVTVETYLSYRDIESQVVDSISKKYKSKSKLMRDYPVGRGHRVDLYVKSSEGSDELYEIKLVRSSASVNKIVNDGIRQLKTYADYLPGKPNLHLILASQHELSMNNLEVSKDVSVETFPLNKTSWSIKKN